MALSNRPRVKWLAMAGVGSLLGLFACQQLLGLDDRKVCTELEPCDASVDAEPPRDGDVLDGGRDGEVDATVDAAEAGPVFPQGSSGSDWITFPMPFPDRGLVDAAAFGGGSPLRFSSNPANRQILQPTDAGAPAVLDTITTRTWFVMSIARSTNEFARALSECERDKGRVPTRIELVSLLDTSPAVDAGGSDAGVVMIRPEVVGTSGLPTAYWSSTAVQLPDRSFAFWIFDFAQGKTFLAKDRGATSYGVICVLK